MRYLISVMVACLFCSFVFAEEKKEEVKEEKIITGEDLIKIVKEYHKLCAEYDKEKSRNEDKKVAKLNDKIIKLVAEKIKTLAGKKINGTLKEKKFLDDKRVCWFTHIKIEDKKNKGSFGELMVDVIKEFATKEAAIATDATFCGVIKKADLSGGRMFDSQKRILIILEPEKK